MAQPEIIRNGLHVAEDMQRQQRLWRIQRVGWAMLGLFLLAGLLGVFGGIGPIGQGTIRSADGMLEVRHARFTRYVAPTELVVRVDRSLVRGGTVELAMARRYLDQWEMYGVTPEPEGVRAEGDELVYAFAVGPGTDAVEIGFHGRPHAVGLLEGTARAGEARAIQFSTWVHP
jgi:hypothetical protein